MEITIAILVIVMASLLALYMAKYAELDELKEEITGNIRHMADLRFEKFIEGERLIETINSHRPKLSPKFTEGEQQVAKQINAIFDRLIEDIK